MTGAISSESRSQVVLIQESHPFSCNLLHVPPCHPRYSPLGIERFKTTQKDHETPKQWLAAAGAILGMIAASWAALELVVTGWTRKLRRYRFNQPDSSESSYAGSRPKRSAADIA